MLVTTFNAMLEMQNVSALLDCCRSEIWAGGVVADGPYRTVEAPAARSDAAQALLPAAPAAPAASGSAGCGTSSSAPVRSNVDYACPG